MKFHWRYKNLTMLGLSLVLIYLVADTDLVHRGIAAVGDWGYLGAFIVGIFFVSTFTVAPSTLVLFYLAQSLNNWEVAIFAGLGATLGDLLIFSFIRDGLIEEIRPLFNFFKKPLFERMINSPYFVWMMPVLGAIIVASPLPDEIGVSLMGISHLKRWQFLIVSLLLNTAGIFIIATLAR